MIGNKKAPPPPIHVGVDFGTTHTIVALADSGNYPILSLPFEYDGEFLVTDHVPTCITLFRGRFYYGPAARACYLSMYNEGAELVSSIKRVLQHWYQGKTIEVGGLHLDVAELVTGFLAQIRQAILQALDLEDAEVEAVIAVPANASSSQRYVTLACFREAGFKVPRILDEPCASGIQFVRERYKRWDRVESNVMIYDLGGGTFDTTYLSIRRGTYDPLLSMGISHLGGDDFDEILLNLVEEESGLTADRRRRLELLQIVREVKEGIGSYTQKLHVETPAGVVSIPMKRFYQASKPLLEETINLVDRVMAEVTGLNHESDRIILVGGGSLLPLVPKMLRERFGRSKIHQGLYPFASVAIGAAIQSDSPQLEIQDRLNNHFGVVRVLQDGREYIDVIFEKGRPLPPHGHVSEVSKPMYDPRYNIGRFQYLECSDIDPITRQARGETVSWNEILFPYDPEIPASDYSAMGSSQIRETDRLRDERIQEEYYLDEYGIITARISRTVHRPYTGRYNLFRG